MTETRIGRYTINVEVAEKNKYDVVLHEDGTIIGQSTGCTGPKSAEYWKGYWVKRAERLNILQDALVMAYHNMGCYRGKDNYKEEYQREKDQAKVLTDWIEELTNN